MWQVMQLIESFKWPVRGEKMKETESIRETRETHGSTKLTEIKEKEGRKERSWFWGTVLVNVTDLIEKCVRHLTDKYLIRALFDPTVYGLSLIFQDKKKLIFLILALADKKFYVVSLWISNIGIWPLLYATLLFVRHYGATVCLETGLHFTILIKSAL